MATGWEDLELVEVGEGRFTTTISEPWKLAIAPQGGAVAAIAVRAMERVLGHPEQTLRTLTAMFAGVVRGGPVEVDVRALRRGRSMSQLTATVRNPGNDAGLTAIAAFGAPRRGYEFTELVMPDVPGPDDLRGFRDPLPEGIDFEFDGDPFPFWDRGHRVPPGDRPATVGALRGGPRRGRLLVSPRPPAARGRRLARRDRRHRDRRHDARTGGPEARARRRTTGSRRASTSPTTCSARARPGWLLAHQRARHAGDGYASVESALWDPAGPNGPTLVGYATQLMLFTFA